MTKYIATICLCIVVFSLSSLWLRAQFREELAQLDRKWSARFQELPARPTPNANPAMDDALSSVKDPGQLLKQLEESSNRIDRLGLAPVERKNEEQRAEQITKQIEGLQKEAIPAIEVCFQRPGILEFKRRLLRLMGRLDREKGFALAESTFLREGEDINVRWAAAGIMKELNREDAEPILSDFVLKNDGKKHQGMLYLLDYLRDIGSFEAQQTLLRVALDGAKEPSVRYRAVEKLGEMKSVEAFPHLQVMIEQSSDGYLRRNAARAMVHIKNEEACIFLKEILKLELDGGFREFAQNLVDVACR